MYFQPYGPVELNRDDKRLLLLDRDAREEFWSRADELDPGLSEACGCYVFAINQMPWYVGKAERQSFKRECLTEHKITKYNSALQTIRRGIPRLYFYARITPIRDHFSKPTGSTYRDVVFLERMLIGLALGRNGNLLNKQETQLLKNMRVPGPLNTGQGRPLSHARDLPLVMGY